MQQLQKPISVSLQPRQERRPFSKVASSFLLASTMILQAKDAAAICGTRGVRWDLPPIITRPKGGEPSLFGDIFQNPAEIVTKGWPGAVISFGIALAIWAIIDRSWESLKRRENPTKGV